MKGLMILLMPLVMSANSCYTLDKKDFKSNLKTEEDVLLNLPSNPQESFSAIVSLDTPKSIAYLGDNYFDCFRDGSIYYCGSDDDGGHMKLKFQNHKVYVALEYARLAETTDDPIIYYTEAKTKKFLEATPTDCFKEVDAIIKVEKEDKKLEIILDALRKEKNIIILDIDSYEDFIIAVGVDNSIDTRKKLSENEYFKSVVLYSSDGGKKWEKETFEQLPLDRVLTIDSHSAVSVGTIPGDGGFISVTYDGGKSWKTVYHGGFINDITKTENGYMAAGFSILKSKDLKRWETSLALDDISLNSILNIDKDLTIAAGDDVVYISRDATKSWEKLDDTLTQSVSFNHIYIDKGNIYIRAVHPEGYSIVSEDYGKSWHANRVH